MKQQEGINGETSEREEVLAGVSEVLSGSGELDQTAGLRVRQAGYVVISLLQLAAN
ncbi:hypothetical protein ACWD6N_31335 [Micromonospora sp. NPDC005163]